MTGFKKLVCIAALGGTVALHSTVALAQSTSRTGFGEPVKPITEAQLPVTPGAPPTTIADGAEVLVVSGYEPSQQPTRIVVSRPGKQVLLVLSSYEKMLWKLDVDAATTLRGVLLSRHDSSGGVISNAQAPLFAVRLPYATTTENINYGGLLAQLGVARADVFRGSYAVPALVTIRELDAPRAELSLAGVAPTLPSKIFSFDLATADFRKRSYKNTGPIAHNDSNVSLLPDSRRAISSSGDKVYDIGAGHGTSISSDGRLLSQRPRLAKQMKGFDRLYDGGNASPPQVLLAPRGTNIAFVHAEGQQVSHIWSYDETTGQVTLTYKRGVPAKP